MGLDIYCGPVSRYVAGDWSTVIQQSLGASGIPVITVRPGDLEQVDWDALLQQAATGTPPTRPAPPKADITDVAERVSRWRSDLIRTLGLNEEWDENPAGEVYTDQPGWDGYGAVILLASYDEQPRLAPGMKTGLFRSRVPAVAPGQFGDAPAFKAASQAPARYPTLLLGAEWCLPLTGGEAVFQAPRPGGKQVTMGHVDRLLSELEMLNQRTLRLSESDLEAARFNGPTSLEATAPFGLGVLMATARFAAKNRVAWIMDY